MAQHVYESSVFERRLRPIYDSLEVGNNRKALVEVDKILKKTPTLLCARALKALALLRMGREDECNCLLKSLPDEKPFDDATLQVLTFCYKEMEQLEKICELYSHAAKHSPGNEEILAHLFISYVRLNDYKSQQATALQLYKLKPKNPYYFWAVMSVVLQGVRGPESDIPEKRKLYLALAQRMVDKLIKEDTLDAEQEVQLYLNILQEQDKYKEALEFMEGPVCKRLYPGAPVTLKIELFKKMSMWEELNTLLKDLLKEERDRWDYYKEYLTSCFELYKTNNGENLNDTGNILEACYEFLCQLIEAGKRVRGPYLARLELHRRMRENQMNAKELLGEFIDLIIEYFRFFGDKQCCTYDIMLFLESLNREERLSLAAKLIRDSGISSTTLPQSKEQMQKHICALQISRVCGSHVELSREHLLALYTALRLHYEHGLSAFGQNLLPTDLGPSDAYSLLAAHIMYDISIKDNKSDNLIEALCLLYHVLENSPSNFHAKLLCLKIYHLLGCGIGANLIYESLDIKHVQLDSMGYLHCLLLPSTGLASIARIVYDNTINFYSTSYKERLEYIAMSYKFGSFSKLQEFMHFRDRLSNSIHYATTSVEQIILKLVCLSSLTVSQNVNTYKLMHINPRDDPLKWDQLADNRDLSVVVRWDPIDMINQNEKKESFDQDVESLLVRSLLLRLISSLIDLLDYEKKTENCVKDNCMDTVQLIKATWDDVFKRLRLTTPPKLSNQFLVNLMPSRLYIMLEMPYEKFFSDLTQFIIDLCSNAELSEERIQQLNDSVTAIRMIHCDGIEMENNAEDNIWSRRALQEKLVTSIEILSLYAFLLSMSHEMYAHGVQGRKSKRKNGAPKSTNDYVVSSDKGRLPIVLSLMRHLKHELQECDNSLKLWKPPQLHSGLQHCMEGMSLNPKNETQLFQNIEQIFKDNHTQTIAELRNIIRDKIRMVNK